MLTDEDISAGLAAPLVAQKLLGTTGEYAMLFLILMKAPLTKKKYTMEQFAIFAIPAGVALLVGGFLYCWYYVRPRLPSARPKEVDAESQKEVVKGEEVEAEEEVKSPQVEVENASVISPISETGKEAYEAMSDLNKIDAKEVYTEDEKDAIKNQIEAECDKYNGQSLPIPTRGGKKKQGNGPCER